MNTILKFLYHLDLLCCKNCTVVGLTLSGAVPRRTIRSAYNSRATGHGFDTRSGHMRFSFCLFKKGSCSNWRKYVHLVPVNRLEGLSLPRNSVVRSSDPPT